jgi:glutamate dehydrogenase
LYPDQAANKGGVISSSLEVLAALAMTDEQYASHMQVVDEQRPPPFYQAFVVSVQATIRAACRKEFLCIEREFAISAQPRSKITDDIACQIDTLNTSICASHLWDNVALRTSVLRQGT